MRYSRLVWTLLLASSAALATSCSKSDSSACSPTDPSCSSPGDTTSTSTPLTVTQVVPSDGATDVDPQTAVKVTFSRAVDATSVTSSSFSVGSLDGTISVSGATATFTPSSPLTEGTSFSVSVDGVVDQDGVGLESAFSSSFTTLRRPVSADAGPDMDVTEGSSVTLDDSGSTGTGASYSWTQIAGPDVGPLDGRSPSFTAPDSVSTLAFELTVSDSSTTQVDTARVWVLEDGDNALWVSPAGSDSNPGTRAEPLATIQAAIDAADNGGQGADVYVAAGTYAESLTLRSRVSVYGGFDPTTWARDINAYRPVVDGDTVAVHGVVSNALTVEGLAVVAADATGVGASSIAVFLDNSVDVNLRNNLFTAGAGTAGARGSSGARGNPGAGGKGGANPTSLCVPGSPGGAGGSSYVAGGKGGAGGLYGGFDGAKGAGVAPGGGGGGGSTYNNGGGGKSATAAGAHGTDGAAGSAFGTLSADGYLPSSGGNGVDNAKPGSGGGGGGGGGGTATSCGPGGGGGGGGGQQGKPGTAGTGGGASIGILLFGTTVAQITGDTITTSSGGAGGAGGVGGAGGSGAGGGSGGSKACEAPFSYPCTGTAGKGGSGSNGGRGGHGGGGGGGPSIGVVEDAGATVTLDGNTFMLGTPGVGGASSGNAGVTGESVAHKKIS